MPYQFRRIVTGHHADGRSRVIIEDNAPNRMEVPGWKGAWLVDIWATDSTPVDISGDQDRGARPIRHDPTPGGSIFRVVELPPDSDIDTDAAFAAMGSHNVPSEADRERHGSMHFTDSVDYLVVLSGELDMIMEDGTIRLRAGDCVVQQGTKHGWKVQGDKPCILAGVLIDANPVKRTG